jgi:hypothetical protein
LVTGSGGARPPAKAAGPHLLSERSNRLPRKVRTLLVVTTNPEIQD